jgi:general secretion pathway protein C
MDVDKWIPRAAVAAVLLVGVSFYFLRTDPPAPDAQAGAAAASGEEGNALGHGIPSPNASADTASELGARGEAALAARTPPPSPPPPSIEPSVPPPAHHRPPKSRAAAELPLADDDGLASNNGSGPIGPCGGIEARLITAADDPEWTFASLASPGEPAAIRRIGDRVGSWRLEKIEWDRVWLRSGGTKCAVGIHVGARAAAESMGGVPEAPLLGEAMPARPPAWTVPHELVTAIEKLAEQSFAIDRPMVSALFERAGDLLAGLKLTPIRKNEETTGIRIEQIRRDSLLDRFGIENGDSLLAINGQPCTNLEATLEAIHAARKSERLVARLDRVGKSLELELVVR